jgi:hypothetical protein
MSPEKNIHLIFILGSIKLNICISDALYYRDLTSCIVFPDTETKALPLMDFLDQEPFICMYLGSTPIFAH